MQIYNNILHNWNNECCILDKKNRISFYVILLYNESVNIDIISNAIFYRIGIFTGTSFYAKYYAMNLSKLNLITLFNV